jgi:hypothetical protein
MRGDVPEGAQLSAEAMQGAQGQAQGRQNMQAVFIGSTQRRIGKKMLWLMRETYKPSLYIPGKDGQDGTWDGPLNAVVTMPDGSKQKVYWNEKALGNDTWVDVDIAANQPGGQQQILNQALALKREQVVDRPYVLQSSGIEGWEGIDDRMSDKKTDDIFVTAAGHAAGVNIKSELAKDAGPTKKVK